MDWTTEGRGSSDGWEFIVQTQEWQGRHSVRVKIQNHPFPVLCGRYDSKSVAVASAVEFAADLIRALRAAEGYPGA